MFASPLKFSRNLVGAAGTLFFAGLCDSALACYQRVVKDPASDFTGPLAVAIKIEL